MSLKETFFTDSFSFLNEISVVIGRQQRERTDKLFEKEAPVCSTMKHISFLFSLHNAESREREREKYFFDKEKGKLDQECIFK